MTFVTLYFVILHTERYTELYTVTLSDYACKHISPRTPSVINNVFLHEIFPASQDEPCPQSGG